MPVLRRKIAARTEVLKLWYHTFHALIDVDLEIKHGIITSLIGPSGCGESTFLRTCPSSALDPRGTEAVEELLWDLRGRYTIIIVTHNMAQARRASDECTFMLLGKVGEHGVTDELFVSPRRRETADYVEGRYG